MLWSPLAASTLIARAVSTSRSYPAFVAAVTAAEVKALLDAEAIQRGYGSPSWLRNTERYNNIWDAAMTVARAAHDATDAAPDAWPFHFDDQVHPDVERVCVFDTSSSLS